MDEKEIGFRRSVGMEINETDSLITGGSDISRLIPSDQILSGGIENIVHANLAAQNPVQQQLQKHALGGVLYINPTSTPAATTTTTATINNNQGILPSTLFIRPVVPMDETILTIHNCQLCKRKFVNPQNLLSHMKSFHLIDTNHIIESNSIRDAAQSTVTNISQSARPLQVQMPDPIQKSSVVAPPPPPTSTTIYTTNTSNNNMPVSFIQPMSNNNTRPPDNRYISILPAPTGPTKNSPLLNTTTTTTSANIPVSLSSMINISSSLAQISSRNNSPMMTTPRITSVVSNASKNLIQTTTTEDRIPVITSTVSKATPEIKVEDDDDDEVECILPQRLVGNIEDAETDVLDEGGKNSPVFLQILEQQQQQQQQRTPRKQNLSQSNNNSNVQKIINLEPYMAKNGILSEKQIDFALTMLEPYYESEEDKLEGRRPEGYRCVICGQIVMNPTNARLHVRHIHLGELYKCAFCGRQFEKKTTRDRHRTHCSRNSNLKSNGGNKNTVTIIQSQIYVNHGGPVTTTTTTTPTEEIGIHPSQLGNHINRTIAKYGDRFECIKCRKKFSAQKYAASHIRLVHFGTHHKCSFCGLIFENNIHIHREKCQKSNLGALNSKSPDNNNKEAEVISSQNTSTNVTKNDNDEEDENSEEIQHLNSIMKESVICIKKKTTIPGTFQQVFQCKLCELDFDKRPNAEAHIWIEHIRTQWSATCGNKNVDGIYLQFLKAQFTNSSSISASSSSSSKVDNNSSSTNKSSYVYAGSIDNVTYTESSTGSLGKLDQSTYEEIEEELPFDPMAFCNNQIFVEESSSFSHESHVEDEGSNTTTTTLGNDLNKRKTVGESSYINDKHSEVQCKLELEDESFCDANGSSGNNSDNDVPQFKIVGYESTANTSMNIESQESKELTEKEINELNMKALRFIKEKSGSFYCIVCQRVSSLRRRLVDHVRLVHLLGGIEENERDTTNTTETGKRSHTPDPDNRLYCCYCEDYFHSMGARIRHEGSCTSMGSRTQEPNIHLAGGTSFPPSSSNIKTSINTSPEERALRFVRSENNEFSCTICKIRSTKADRLIHHIRRTHFGEALDCRGCKRTFPDEATKNRHLIRCSSFKRLQESSKNNKKMGNRDVLTKLGSKSNVVIDRNGIMRKKPGRPFRNLVMTDTSSQSQSGALQMGKVIDSMTGQVEEEKIKTISSNRPNLRSSSSSASSVVSKNSQNSTIAKNKQDQDKHENKKQSISSAPTTTTKTKTINSSTTTTSTISSQKKLTIEQSQQAKDMIIPWRVGGLYAFSKCKECSTLFSKYSNAEIHVRNVHMLGEKNGKSQESSIKNTSDSTKHQNLKRSVGKRASSEDIPAKTTKYNENIEQVNLDDDNDDDKIHSNHSDQEWDRNDDDNRMPTDAEEEEESEEKIIISRSVTSPKKPKSLAVDVRKKYKNFRERLHHCQNCNTQIFGDTQFQSHKKTCIGNTTNNSKNHLPTSSKDLKHFKKMEIDVLTPELIKEAMGHLEKLKAHRTGNKVIERYKCKICNIVLRGLASECLRHVRIMHFGERRHQCRKCGERFAYRKPYLNHEYNCEGTSKPNIENSNKPKEEEEEGNEDVIPLNNSGSFSVREVYRCKICNETYVDKSLCLYHLTSHVEALKSLGKPGQDLDAMESLIDNVSSKAKCYIKTPSRNFFETTKSTTTTTIKDESSTNNNKSLSNQPSQQSKRITSITTQQLQQQKMPVIMDTHTVSARKSSLKTNKKVYTDSIIKPIKVYSSSSAFLKETSTELGYYLYEGKLEPLLPSYVQLGKKLDNVGEMVVIGKNNHHKKVGGGQNIQKKNHGISQRSSLTNTTTTIFNETKPKLPISTSSSRCFSSGVSEFVQIDWPMSETGVLTDEEISKAHSLIYETNEIGDQPEIQQMYRCMVCSAHDKSLEKMQQHSREQHFGELPFPCLNEDCDKRFQKSLAMKLHSRICCAKKEHEYGEIPEHMRPRKKIKRKKGLNLIKKSKGSKKKLGANIYSSPTTSATGNDDDTEEQKDNYSDFDEVYGGKNTKKCSSASTIVKNIKIEQLESSLFSGLSVHSNEGEK